MACRACHSAKVKCDMSERVPCSRCARLSLECVPHQSRQGQGPKKRRKASDDGVETDVLKSVSKQLGPKHYGLHFMIRHWIAMAYVRRSFGLLSKATELATKFRITMDQIMCGDEYDGINSGPMDYVPEILLKETEEQTSVDEGFLTLDELPANLLQAIQLDERTIALDPQRHPDNRWVFIGQALNGRSKFYSSKAFERDVCPQELIRQTWKENKMEIKDLFLADPVGERVKLSQVVVQQFSFYTTATKTPSPSRVPKLTIKLASSEQLEVECFMCLGIKSLDHGFWCIEFKIPHNYVNPNLVQKKTHQEDEPLHWENIDPIEWTDDWEGLLGKFSGLV